MKLFTGWIVSAGLFSRPDRACARGSAAGTDGSPYVAVTDVGGPYAPCAGSARAGHGYGPTLFCCRRAGVYTGFGRTLFAARRPQQLGMFT